MAERASRLQASVCAEQTKPHKRENLCKQPQLRAKPKTDEAVGEMTDEVTGELRCGYYQRGECRSCALIDLPYASQIAQKSARAAELVPARTWLPPVESEISHFRNKAKLVVSGTLQNLKLGIMGQDLRNCPLPTRGIQAAIPTLAEFVQRCELTPYNFKTNTGVLKYILLTQSPTGELMVRFVVRRRGVQGIIFRRYAWLAQQLPQMRVCSINVQPERKAIIEGDEEILVSEQAALPMPLQLNFALSLQPKSFFQTNTPMAEALYSRAATWILQYFTDLQAAANVWGAGNIAGIDHIDVMTVGKAVDGAIVDAVAAEGAAVGGETADISQNSHSVENGQQSAGQQTDGRRLQIWDLYCGVGGFAFAAALAALQAAGQDVRKIPSDHKSVCEISQTEAASATWTADHSGLVPQIYVSGVETSRQAVEAANHTAREYSLPAEFFAADALSWAKERLAAGAQPEIIIVNPPRRGIGSELAGLLNTSGAARIIYSSCNAQSLAQDLQQMPNYCVEQAQLIDIFPHTTHFETICLLSRITR